MWRMPNSRWRYSTHLQRAVLLGDPRLRHWKRPVAVPFCPGKTPSDEEVRSCVRRMVQRVRTHWPDTRINVRGNRHYGRPEVMAWCEASGLTYVFGLAGNSVLDRMVGVIADDLRGRRAEAHPDVVRMQLVDSVIRAPILIRCIWMVLNSARASGRICRMASSAGGGSSRRTWLASGERQLVQS